MTAPAEQIARPQWIIREDWTRRRVRALGAQITDDLGGLEVTVVPVLTGAFIFGADLMRCLDIMDVRVQWARAASYDAEMRGDLKVDLSHVDPAHIAGRHVLLVDDILDTGNTMHELVLRISAMSPASVRIAVLLRKRARHDPDIDVEPHYVGFEIPDLFVVGYGLDVNGLHRHWSYIGVLDSDLTPERHAEVVADIERQLGAR